MTRYNKNDILFPIKHKIKKEEKYLASFDIETSGTKNKFYSCGIEDEEGFHYFLEEKEAIKYLFSISKKYSYVFATNLNFDFEGLFRKHSSYIKAERIHSGSRLIGVNIGSLQMSDTLNFAMMSLKDLGKSVGEHKLEAPSTLGKTPKHFKDFNELYIYNKQDCKVTLLFMQMVEKEVKQLGGELKLTAGATSLYLFRRKFLRKTILKEHIRLENDKVLKLIRASLYGGRTETFIRGKLDIKSEKLKKFLGREPKLYYYDINAMYPSVMRNKYPDSDSVRYHKNGYEKSIYYFEGVSNVTIFCPNMNIPFLPFRSKEGRLLFPTGTFRGTYTHLELRHAIKLGYKIKSVHETIYYRKTWFPFIDYVKTMYALRRKYKENKNPAQSVIKIFMNSLFGKFSQREITEIDFYAKDEKIPKNKYMLMKGEEILKNRLHETKNINYVTSTKECDASHVFPILSSYVTAYARILLHSYLVKTIPVYCDTDSIVCFRRLEDSTKLGKMKLEDEFRTCLYIRPKLYSYTTLKGRVVFRGKGIPRLDSAKWGEIINARTVFYTKILRTKEAYKLGLNPNETKEVFKKLDLEDVKRSWKEKFNKNDFEVSTPLCINE